MLPTVAEKGLCTETASPPVVIVQEGKHASSNKKKYVVIAVSVVTVAAILVGGFVAGMYLIHKSSSNMVEVMNFRFKEKDGSTAQETIKADTAKKQTEIEVKKDGEGFKVINDFKRGIAAYRVSKTGEDGVCYISPLNVSDVMDPETLKNYKQQHPNPDVKEEERSEERKFDVAKEPVSDTSFLGDSVQEMCKDLKVYWLYPAQKTDRQKRACYYRYRCYYYYRYVYIGGRLYRIRYRRCYRYRVCY